ncbi:MAG: cytochrome c biogenesis protein CcsA [Gammaproteobacteria bacterium]|nr:cytochrome c biogenesis protein CcsA [Gammaproteobacteria bacterium]MBU1731742.1 cytochrome c biogenesis protein CcsA [Gammaproteobacteria bacterium]MBU1892566.1 cytochrome c biogenesis protein CcsA [Gammaproteobacteria bacterium]
MPDLLPLFLTAFLYAGLGAYSWRGLWLEKNTATAPQAWEKPAILVPLLLHIWLLLQLIVQPDGIKLGVGQAVSAIAWLTVLVYWLGSLRNNLEGLQGFVLPFAAISLAAPSLFPATHTLLHTEEALFKVHLFIAILAYSLFTIAAMHALLMAVAERRLHSKALSPLSTLLQRLPPLLTMEHLLFRILWAGFTLLTLTLLSGMLFSEELFGKALQLSHKTIFAIISWGIYAALLGGRLRYGWRGRIAIRWTLSGFMALLLAYIGSKFVLEIILGR